MHVQYVDPLDAQCRRAGELCVGPQLSKSAVAHMNSIERVAFLEATLTRQLHWIDVADSKVTFGFAVNTTMLGVLAAMTPASSAGWSTVPAICASFAIAFELAALLFLSFASFPRTLGPKGSLLFFGGITQRNPDQYKQAVQSLSVKAYTNDLSEQCHRNAEIAAKKFSWVQRALTCVYLSVPPWGLSLWLLYDATS